MSHAALEVAVVVGGVPQYPFRPNPNLSPGCKASDRHPSPCAAQICQPGPLQWHVDLNVVEKRAVQSMQTFAECLQARLLLASRWPDYVSGQPYGLGGPVRSDQKPKALQVRHENELASDTTYIECVAILPR